jgi:hypothetical protein
MSSGEFRFDDEGGARRATAEHLEARSCGAGVRRDCCNEAPQRLSRSPRGAFGVEQLSSGIALTSTADDRR